MKGITINCNVWSLVREGDNKEGSQNARYKLETLKSNKKKNLKMTENMTSKFEGTISIMKRAFQKLNKICRNKKKNHL